MYFYGLTPMLEKLKDEGWVLLAGYGHVCPRCNDELSAERMEELAKSGEVLRSVDAVEKLRESLTRQDHEMLDLRNALDLVIGRMNSGPSFWKDAFDDEELAKIAKARDLYNLEEE